MTVLTVFQTESQASIVRYTNVSRSILKVVVLAFVDSFRKEAVFVRLVGIQAHTVD